MIERVHSRDLTENLGVDLDDETDPEQLWRIDKVAKFYDVNPRTVRCMVAAGKLPAFYVGVSNHAMRFRPSDVEAAMTLVNPSNIGYGKPRQAQAPGGESTSTHDG
jgi:hypothetical protein